MASPSSGSTGGSTGGGPAASDRFRDDPEGYAAAYGPAGYGAEERPADALRDAAGRIGELKEYAAYYVATKLDAWKGTAVNLAIYAVLGLLGAVIGATVLVMATVLFMGAIANALGNLFGHWFGAGWAWLGPFLVGLVILGGLAAGVLFGLKWFAGMTRSRLVAKYRDRQRRQRVNYGHDVEQRAQEQRAHERAAAGK